MYTDVYIDDMIAVVVVVDVIVVDAVVVVVVVVVVAHIMRSFANVSMTNCSINVMIAEN